MDLFSIESVFICLILLVFLYINRAYVVSMTRTLCLFILKVFTFRRDTSSKKEDKSGHKPSAIPTPLDPIALLENALRAAGNLNGKKVYVAYNIWDVLLENREYDRRIRLDGYKKTRYVMFYENCIDIVPDNALPPNAVEVK